MQDESIEKQDVSSGVVNKSSLTSLADKSYLTTDVVNQTDATIQKAIRQPSGDDIVPEFDVND